MKEHPGAHPGSSTAQADVSQALGEPASSSPDPETGTPAATRESHLRCDKRFGVEDVNGFRLVDPNGPRCDAVAVTAFRAECPRGHSEVKTGCAPHADRMRSALATGTRALCSVCARRDGIRTNAVIREIPLTDAVSESLTDSVRRDLAARLDERLWTEGGTP